MKNEIRWTEIENIFNSVCNLSARERAARLTALCRGNPELFDNVNSLLQKHFESPNFLETPPLANFLLTKNPI